MKIEISKEDMIQVLLAKIAEMDPEEARDELYDHYAQEVYPELSDEELAVEFYERVVNLEVEASEEGSAEASDATEATH